jgi:hypothetical protein
MEAKSARGREALSKKRKPETAEQPEAPAADTAPSCEAPVYPTALSETDHLKIQLAHTKAQQLAAQREAAELRGRMLERDAQVLQLQMREQLQKVSADMAASKATVARLTQDEAAHRSQIVADMATLSARYGLEGQAFSFNPDTLEIVK